MYVHSVLTDCNEHYHRLTEYSTLTQIMTNICIPYSMIIHIFDDNVMITGITQFCHRPSYNGHHFIYSLHVKPKNGAHYFYEYSYCNALYVIIGC